MNRGIHCQRQWDMYGAYFIDDFHNHPDKKMIHVSFVCSEIDIETTQIIN